MPSFLDEMLTDIRNKGRNKGAMFTLGKGEKAMVRFVTELTAVIKIDVHGRYVQGNPSAGYTIPCLRAYGHDECWLDNHDELPRNTKKQYGLIVYDYRDSSVKVMFYKANGCTPLDGIAAVYQDAGTITASDIVITRNEESNPMLVRYTVVQRPYKAVDPDVQKEIDRVLPVKDVPELHAFMRQQFAMSNFPALLKPGPIKLPDIVMQDDVAGMMSQKDQTASVFDDPAAARARFLEKRAQNGTHANGSAQNKDYGTINVPIEDGDELLNELGI